ncbi:hypothetical protein BDZ89DRAFT_1143459 [Hymenopellis radicata]|nr:hypothetical protein BDZ89DRAFT_1143459 [Hymenopellis radicata]
MLAGLLETAPLSVKAVVTGAIGSTAELQSLGLGSVMLECLMPITEPEDVEELTPPRHTPSHNRHARRRARATGTTRL